MRGRALPGRRPERSTKRIQRSFADGSSEIVVRDVACECGVHLAQVLAGAHVSGDVGEVEFAFFKMNERGEMVEGGGLHQQTADGYRPRPRECREATCVGSLSEAEPGAIMRARIQ